MAINLTVNDPLWQEMMRPRLYVPVTKIDKVATAQSLRNRHHKTVRQIATIMNVTSSTVRKYLSTPVGSDRSSTMRKTC